MTQTTASILLAAALALPLTATAGMRCAGGALVNEGESASYMFKNCGNPMASSDLVNGFGAVVGQRYRYVDRTDNSWVHVIDVHNGKVTRMDTERQ